MDDVRILESAEDYERFRELIRYCFSDEFSQTAPLFNFFGDSDISYGLYEEGVLNSAIISRSFTSHLWGEPIHLNGITYVASAPEARNRGHIRILMERILQDAYASGARASALYPFLFRFYAKFGYGNAGPVYAYRFRPEDIRPEVLSRIGGGFEPLTGGREELDKTEKIGLFARRFDEAQRLYNEWVRNYTLGIELPYTAEQYRRYLGTQNEQAYLYRNPDGEAVGFIQYKMTPAREDNVKIRVSRFAYTSEEGFRALVGFLARHRNQCLEIKLSLPSDVPLQLIMQEPRIRASRLADWMARPLAVPELLQMRIRASGFSGTLRFSLQDPVIEENTATYTINSGQLSVSAFTGENELSFESFASLLFGGYTWRNLSLSGRVPSAADGLLTPKTEAELAALFGPAPALMFGEEF
ncbi:MAG: GNAT family N-acetyltransferase [Spirochaetota bacterium]